MELRAQGHTKGTHGQENPPPELPGDEIQKRDSIGIISLKRLILT